MNNSCQGIRSRAKTIFVSAVLISSLLSGVFVQWDADSVSCDEWRIAGQRSPTLNTSGICRNTYCAGLVLFCCDDGRPLGVCVGAWGCN